jgi:hypothetical protein
MLWIAAAACRPAASADPAGQPGDRDEPAIAAPERSEDPGEAAVASERSDQRAVAERMAWMVGRWVAHADGRQESETWEIDGDALSGRSESHVDGRLVHHERLRVQQRGDAVVYEAQPSTQPPHAFTLTFEAPGHVRFEDPAHDWPQSIEYVRDGGTLTATVRGTTPAGEERRAVWTWTLAP